MNIFEYAKMRRMFGSSSGGGSSGGEVNLLDSIIDGSFSGELKSNVSIIRNYAFAYISGLTKATLPEAVEVGSGAFYQCQELISVDIPKALKVGGAFKTLAKLKRVNAPMCTELSGMAFDGCSSLVYVNMPSLLTLKDNYNFQNCKALTEIRFPLLTTYTGGNTFSMCTSLKFADMGYASRLGDGTFKNCTKLETIILRYDGVVPLQDYYGTAINTTAPIVNGTGYVYVPKAYLEEYPTATNWVSYSFQFRAIEDYPEICGGNAV